MYVSYQPQSTYYFVQCNKLLAVPTYVCFVYVVVRKYFHFTTGNEKQAFVLSKLLGEPSFLDPTHAVRIRSKQKTLFAFLANDYAALYIHNAVVRLCIRPLLKSTFDNNENSPTSFK